jgi:hypothetical protein
MRSIPLPSQAIGAQFKERSQPYKKSVQTSQRVAVSVSAIALILLIPTGAIFEHKSVLLAIVVAVGYAGNMFSKRIRVRFKSTAFNA